MSLVVLSDTLGPPCNYRLVERDFGPLEAGRVRIAVKAVGVSHADLLLAGGRYQVVPSVPYIPGTECAGIVEALGEGVAGIEPGMHVVARGIGGLFAEHADVIAKSVSIIPESIDFNEAAVLVLSYATAWHALHQRAMLRDVETLVVLGAAGATGLAAIQVGKQLGAQVIASASSEAKRELALRAGADAVVDSGSETWREDLKAANSGKPVDVVFDPVGGRATEPAFRSLAWGGRHLVVGFVDGMTALRTNLALLKGSALVGVDIRQFEILEPEAFASNLSKIFALAAKGTFRPAIAERFPITQFAKAMEAVAAGTSAGRIIINP